MTRHYPDPCVGCTQRCNSGGIGCEKWRIRYLYRQKQINSYARKMLQPEVVMIDTFCYLHPTELRHRLQRSPCEGCKLNNICDYPCDARLKWWDVQMGEIRRKLHE